MFRHVTSPRAARWFTHGTAVLALALGGSACSNPVGDAPASAPRGDGPPVAAPSVQLDAAPSPAASGSAPIVAATPPTNRRPSPNAEAVHAALVGDPASEGAVTKVLADAARGDARFREALDVRWRAERGVHDVALALWDAHHVVVGTEPAQLMDGGFRGRLHLVPEPPVGPFAKHLAWVRDAHRGFAEVFAAVGAKAPAIERMRFRTEGVVYGFFRSVGRTTPSAYASGWHVAYNVSGSLHGSASAVEDTLFHEIFHLNDEADGWSGSHLRAIHQGILEACKDQPPSTCLAPYAPTTTVVRGGTYYSFQPDNGDAVNEYGAEIATRWFEEHRALSRHTAPPKGSPFKCRKPENGKAWALVVEAFFAGVDLVPACP